MKVEVKKVNEVKRELKFEIPKERVSKTLDEVYTEIGRVANVKGFRKGKVPRNILEARHAQTAKSEVIQKIIPEVYHEGIKQENLQPIDMPEIDDVNYENGIITFTAKLDIKPDIQIKEYKGIKVKRKSNEITDDEINKTLEYFKQGQNKDVAIDDAFAKGLGYPTLEEFKNSLKRQLEIDKDRQNRADVENQIVEYLLKKTKFATPESLVKRQVHHRVHQQIDRLKEQGMKEEDLHKKHHELEKELQPLVEKDVRVYLILDKIGELEKIEAKEGENLPAKVMEFLLKEAQWT